MPEAMRIIPLGGLGEVGKNMTVIEADGEAVVIDAGQSKTVHVDFPVSTLAETQGDINASSPPKVEPGAYVVQLNNNNATPYDVAVSAPFTIH